MRPQSSYFVKDKMAFFLNPSKAFVASILFAYSKIRTSFFSNTVITHIVKSPFAFVFWYITTTRNRDAFLNCFITISFLTLILLRFI